MFITGDTIRSRIHLPLLTERNKSMESGNVLRRMQHCIGQRQWSVKFESLATSDTGGLNCDDSSLFTSATARLWENISCTAILTCETAILIKDLKHLKRTRSLKPLNYLVISHCTQKNTVTARWRLWNYSISGYLSNKFLVLMHCLSVFYVVCLEWASNILFQCIVSILWVKKR